MWSQVSHLNRSIDKMADKYKQKQDLIKAEINEFMKVDATFGAKKEDTIENMIESPRRLKNERSISDINSKSTKQLRDEIKQRKQALRDVARVQATSKIGLSKLVTSLEKQNHEDEKKIEILHHKLSQAAQEKQMFKQKYETLKTKVKTNETDDIKLIKTISLETREKYNKSPMTRSRQQKAEFEKGGLRSLQQARLSRKDDPDNGENMKRSFIGPADSSQDQLDIPYNHVAQKNRTPRRITRENMKKSSFEDDDVKRPSQISKCLLLIFRYAVK